MNSKYRYLELEVPLVKKEEYREVLARTLHIHPEEIFNLKVERFSLDSRKKGAPHWSYNLTFEAKKKLKANGNHAKGLTEFNKKEVRLEDEPFVNSHPIAPHIDIIGAGPAGLWCALHLLKKGFSVDLYEQGKCVEERFRDIRKFFGDRKFNRYSNVLFGEGGAGAFSDGKLNTRSRNIFSEMVLKDMVALGVDEEVITFAKPHIGTDKLVLLLRNLRHEITSLGGKIHFNTALEDIEIKSGRVSAIKLKNTSDNSAYWKNSEALVLAVGHSAREVYELLFARGVALESKSFAMGVRVEHPQSLINLKQLGAHVDTKITGAAEYFLASPTLNKTSSAYSFCMCSGGVLVPCASEPETLATNGMSYSKRNGPFANGAIVVPIEKSEQLFDGLNLQRKIERNAFYEGAKNYTAPAQSIENFLKHATDKTLRKTTYPCGIIPSNLWDWMDEKICKSLAEGFENFERKIPGFIKNGLIVAPETRTSSPLRMPRNPETLESINTQGLYVLGEGAGYSGGIVTSAADGIRLAAIAKK